jgi:hypothetical protein
MGEVNFDPALTFVNLGLTMAPYRGPSMKRRLSGGPVRKMTFLALFTTVGAVLLVGCGSSSGPASTSAASTTSTSASAASTTSTSTLATFASAVSTSSSGNGVNPNAPESLPPGDIPDTTAYVAYAVPGAGYTVSTPEGWSRSNRGGVVTWTSNLNAVRISAAPAHGPLTVASVRRQVLPPLASSLKGYKFQSISVVKRTAGQAIRTVYLGYSTPNPVTNKFGVLAFERYDFLHKGRVVTLVLSSPNGSDNVDPWRKITNSLRFTR